MKIQPPKRVKRIFLPFSGRIASNNVDNTSSTYFDWWLVIRLKYGPKKHMNLSDFRFHCMKPTSWQVIKKIQQCFCFEKQRKLRKNNTGIAVLVLSVWLSYAPKSRIELRWYWWEGKWSKNGGNRQRTWKDTHFKSFGGKYRLFLVCWKQYNTTTINQSQCNPSKIGIGD